MLDTGVLFLDYSRVILCGREFNDQLIARLNSAAPTLSRSALSKELCRWLQWRGPSGKWQTTNARIALHRLHRLGLVQLPPPAAMPSKRPVSPSNLPPPRIRGSLAEVGPIEVILAGSRHSAAAGQGRQLLQAFHPLGARLCGTRLLYLIACPQGFLGVIAFSAAARRLRPRDQWIGWNDKTRAENLHLVINNSRFLICPGVQVPHLASHALAMVLRRLAQDWQQRHGYRPWLVESFVEKHRHSGTCYRASNWLELNEPTAGRGRNDAKHSQSKTPKRIFLHLLGKSPSDVGQALNQLPARLRLAQRPRLIPPKAPPADWAQEELGSVQLKDERLRKRVLVLARDCYARPQSNLPQRCGGDRAKTKAAYRFFDHTEVTMDALLQSHYAATAQRVAKEALVLVPQDTTYLNYSAHPATERLGPIGSRADSGLIGLVVHDTMAFNLEGTPLGLVHVQCWARDPAQFGKKHRRRQLQFEEKESVKWLRSLQALARLQSQCPQTQLVSVGDREADIYELFAWAAEQAARPKLLVRAEHNRRLADEHGYLWEQMAAQPLAAIKEVRLPRREKRPARVARLEVRFGCVELRAPKTRAKLPNVKGWVVWAREVDAPAQSQAVEWMLLTTLAVENFEQACEKLDWYTRRWGIEVFHRTLKSGCQIEERQLGSADRIEGCLAIDLIVAWRIFHLAKLGREMPDVPCTVFFEEIEWKALVGFKTKVVNPPEPPPSLREAIRMVASLGGFLGRKGDGQPGTQTIWLGLQRLDDIAESWRVFSKIFNVPVTSNRTYG